MPDANVNPVAADPFVMAAGTNTASTDRNLSWLTRSVATPLPYASAYVRYAVATIASLGSNVVSVGVVEPDVYHITHLPGEPYRLLRPIPIVIQRLGEADFMASFEIANIAVSGLDINDAYQSIAMHLLDVFESLIAEEGNLGPGPSKQLQILKSYLVPK